MDGMTTLNLRHLEDLYPHQIEGVRFLLRKQKAILADDMGLGKTRQAIVAMLNAAPDGQILVICPASLKLNWMQEILAVDPTAAVAVITKDNAAAKQSRWVIVNYERLGSHRHLLRNTPWAGVIVDEAHYIKNHEAERTKQVIRIVAPRAKKGAPAPNRSRNVFLLTGTPMTSRPRDLFTLIGCVGHPAARSFREFAERYCAAYDGPFGFVTDGASKLDELNLLLKEVMLWRKKDDVLNLPLKIRRWLQIEITDKAVLKQQKRILDWLRGRSDDAPGEQTLLGHLQTLRVALHGAKHQAVTERINHVLETGQKVLVFTAFTEGLQKHKKKLGNACVTLSGEDKPAARELAVAAFQNDPNVRVLVANLKAGGLGITLTAATHVIFQDLDWVPATLLQAEDRAFRIGQSNTVTIEYIVAARSLDTHIAKLLTARIAMIGQVQEDHRAQESIVAALEAELRSGHAMTAETADEAFGGFELLSASPDPNVRPAPHAVTHLFRPTALTSLPDLQPQRLPPGGTVRLDKRGIARCDCGGFKLHGNCRHVRAARKQLYS